MWINGRNRSVKKRSGGRLKAGSALPMAFAVLCLAAIPMSQADASTVVDGSFNAPFGGATFTNLEHGQSFSSWSVTGSGSGAYGAAGVDLIGGYWAAPTPGGGSVDLDGLAPGGITQSITLAAGSYVLSFYLSGNPDGGPSDKSVEVSVGNALKSFTYTVTGANNSANMNYELKTVSFTLDSAATIPLSFRSLDGIDSPYGAVIGDVSIAAVPEPTTWAMMIVGFCGLGMIAYRRRSKAALRLA